MKKRAIPAWGSALAAGLIAAPFVGCGDEASPPRPADFVRRANEICYAGKTQQAIDLQRYLRGNPGQSPAKPGREAVETILLPSVRAQIAAIRELGAPAGDERTIEAILVALATPPTRSKTEGPSRAPRSRRHSNQRAPWRESTGSTAAPTDTESARTNLYLAFPDKLNCSPVKGGRRKIGRLTALSLTVAVASALAVAPSASGSLELPENSLIVLKATSEETQVLEVTSGGPAIECTHTKFEGTVIDEGEGKEIPLVAEYPLARRSI